jgi:hypothetical protein
MSMTPKDERRAKRDEAIKARGTYRPTPTQEENDLKALGVPIDENPKQSSGAPPDKREETRRAMWPKRDPRGGYVTK